MNMVLLVLYLIAETALAGISINKKTDRTGWSLGRFVVDAGELVIFAVSMITPEVDLGMRFRCLAVLLAVRFLIAGICYLVRRRKEAVPQKKFSTIGSGILAMVLFVTSLLPSFIFADYRGLETTGTYGVATAEAILVDESRTETFETDGSCREVPVYFFYPSGAKEGETFPVVFFSHGAFGYNKSNYSTYCELVSNGYVVVSMEHPYHAMFTRDTNGKLITVNTEMFNNSMKINEDSALSEEEIYDITSVWMTLRLQDADFVVSEIVDNTGNYTLPEHWYTEDQSHVAEALSCMDTEKMGFMGHSLGGATAVTIGRQREDIDAVIDLDGTMLGEVLGVEDDIDIINEELYTTPILSVENQEHHMSKLELGNMGLLYVNQEVMNHAETGYCTYFAGAGHMNFTDLPLFSPFLASMLGTGAVDAEACITTMNQLVLEFFNAYLKGEGNFRIQECY